jgi:hypothetical protein
MKKETKRYKAVITPALPVGERHQIEEAIEKLGYVVTSGGMFLNMSECDFSFEKEVTE